MAKPAPGKVSVDPSTRESAKPAGSPRRETRRPIAERSGSSSDEPAAEVKGRTARLLEAQLERLHQSGWAGLSGSQASIRLVIDEALVNEVVADAIVSRQPGLRELQVGFGADNLVDVRVKPSGRFMPPVRLQLEVESTARLHPAPAIRLRIRKKGFSTVVASILPMVARALPPEVRLSGENVDVDLATLLARWELSWVLAWLIGLEIATVPGQLQLALKLKV